MASDGIRLFRTLAHPCGYYADRLATNQVLDPQSPLLAQFYDRALAHGFRRAGDVVYRPHCNTCHACVPYRIPVAQFVTTRAQRRVLARNQDVQIIWRRAEDSDEHFKLYQRYVGQRHAAGGMDQPTPDDYRRFLLGHWSSTWFMEMRLHEQLIGAAVTDLVGSAASAVYTYFQPDLATRSLGTLGILKQIEYCRAQSLTYLYLGFWIDSHPKMHYKQHFGPAQVRVNDNWQPA